MTGNDYFDKKAGLIWSEELGMGYYPVKDPDYDDAYFKKYVEYEDTEMGKVLTEARLTIVETFAKGQNLVDIGIGSGQFMKAAGCAGYDVNPVAVQMLHNSGMWFDPKTMYIQCATFWDSLEHIPNIHEILEHIRGYIFVSLPVFDNLQYVLKSKHFRPNEHYWYFTIRGFREFIAAHGFDVVFYSEIETDLGRDGIGTFVCKRVN